MKKNYFEHEISSRFVDGVLKKDTKWQWLIDYIEENFDFDEVDNKLSFINDQVATYSQIYKYFIKIVVIDNFELYSKKNIINEIIQLALFYNDKIILEDIEYKNKSNFFKYLLIGIIFAKTYCENFIYDFRLLTENNLFKIIDVTKITDRTDLILGIIDSIEADDIDKIRVHFLNNVNKINIPFDENILYMHKEELVNANTFDYTKIKDSNDLSWEYRYLYDMVSISIDNKKIKPYSVFEGVAKPDTSLWDNNAFKKLETFYCGNEIATFIYETIRYLVLNQNPSDSVIEKHFELFKKQLENYVNNKENFLECSSLKMISYFMEDRIVSKTIRDKYLKDIINLEGKLSELNDFLLLDEYKILYVNREIVNDYKKKEVEKIHQTSDIRSLYIYVAELKYYEYINDTIFDLLFDKVSAFLKESNDGIFVASLFLVYKEKLINMLQFTQVSLVNKEIIKSTLIYLDDTWKTTLYEKVFNSMKKINQKFSFSSEELTEFNTNVINNTYVYTHYFMFLNEVEIIKICSNASQNVLIYFCNNISVDEFGPKHKGRDLDDALETINELVEYQSKIINNNRHRFLNQLDSEDKNLYNEIIFDAIDDRIIYNISLINAQDLYRKIKKSITEAKLVNFNKNIKLAHITQLFPILEIKIRNLAKKYNILPFKLEQGKYDDFRDPSSILKDIINFDYENNKSFNNVADFLFIYYVMYSSKGLNYRNKFIHGQVNLKNDNTIKNVFIITLICLKLIIDREELIKKGE